MIQLLFGGSVKRNSKLIQKREPSPKLRLLPNCPKTKRNSRTCFFSPARELAGQQECEDRQMNRCRFCLNSELPPPAHSRVFDLNLHIHAKVVHSIALFYGA